MNASEKAILRLRAAVDNGKIKTIVSVWSPKDTVADTRYQYVDNHGESHILRHSEVNGFLTGMGE